VEQDRALRMRSNGVEVASHAPATAQARVACPVCGTARMRSLSVRTKTPAFRRCAGCGTGYWTTRWTGEQSLSHYAGYYGRPVQYDPLTERRYEALLARIEQGRSGRRLLDIGCGAGHFLAVAAGRGWQATGLEISSSAREVLERLKQDRGLSFTILEKVLAEAGVPDRSMDLVSLVEVLEHVDEPLALLRDVHRVLDDGGVVYLTTPNADSASHRVLGSRWRVVAEEHRCLWTPRGLRQALLSAGLTPLMVATKNLDLAELADKWRRGGAPEAGRVSPRRQAQVMRHAIERSASLRALKAAANAVLGACALGDTIEAIAVKPAGGRA